VNKLKKAIVFAAVSSKVQRDNRIRKEKIAHNSEEVSKNEKHLTKHLLHNKIMKDLHSLEYMKGLQVDNKV
jgi:hypothetical protein